MQVAIVYANRDGERWTVDLAGTTRQYDSLEAVQAALGKVLHAVSEALGDHGGALTVSLECETDDARERARVLIEERFGDKEIVEIPFPAGGTTRPGRPGRPTQVTSLVVEPGRGTPNGVPAPAPIPASQRETLELDRRVTQVDSRITNVFRQLEQIRARLSEPTWTETDMPERPDTLRRIEADMAILQTRLAELESKRYATEAQVHRELERLRHELRQPDAADE